MRRSLAAAFRGLILFLGYGGIAVAATWPLARLLPWATTYFGDPLINSWILSWVTSAPTGILNVYDAPLFHPSPLSLTFSENLFGLAAVAWPLTLFLDALTLHNLLLVLSFPLTGLAVYYLARAAAVSRSGAVIAGLLFMMHPWRLTQLPHLQFEWALWLPLTLMAVILFSQKPSRIRAVLLGVCFLFNGLSNLHYFAFSVLLVPLTMFLLAPADRKVWIRGAVALGGSGGILAIVLWPYRVAAGFYGVRTSAADLERYSAHASDWLVGALGPAVYRSWIIDVTVDPERWLFPGVVLTILTLLFVLFSSRLETSVVERPAASALVRLLIGVGAALALIGFYRTVHVADADNAPVYLLAASVVWAAALLARSRQVTGALDVRAILERSRFTPEQWACISWIVVGFVGSLGVNSFLHPALSEITDLFGGIRAPARWAVVAYIGMAVLAGAATDRFVRSAKARIWIQLLLVVLIIAEVWPAPIRYQLLSNRSPEVYEWLGSCDGAVIAELPIHQEQEYLYVLGESIHQSESVNGVSGFEPPFHASIREMWSSDPVAAELVDTLREAGVNIVIVHADTVRNVESARQWLDQELAGGRLVPVARFADGWRGDWAFRVRGSAEPRCAAIPPGVVQGASARTVFDLSPDDPRDWTFGHVDRPAFHETISGPLTVSGWALSPEEIESVSVHVDHRRLSYDVEQLPGPDLVELFGPMAEGNPRFRVEIPRPDNVPEQTDLQVRVVTKSGEVIWLPQIWFNWTDR